jgi:uncharacterized protein YjbJ (UPF0337 family)
LSENGEGSFSALGGRPGGTFAVVQRFWSLARQQRKGTNMVDKDRVKGSARQAKGAVKSAAGKIVGDSKLESEGKAERAAGKVQNAIGGIKDSIRGK